MNKKNSYGKKRKKEKEQEQKDKKNISVERRTSCIEKICFRCKALYLSEIEGQYTRCGKCNGELVRIDNAVYDLQCPQYGGKA